MPSWRRISGQQIRKGLSASPRINVLLADALEVGGITPVPATPTGGIAGKSLWLQSAVPTPAKGQIGAGDAVLTVIGNGSGRNIGFNANGRWSQYAASGAVTFFVLLGNGTLFGSIAATTTTANDNTPAFTLPVTCRPKTGVVFFNEFVSSGPYRGYIGTDGTVNLNDGSQAGKNFLGQFYFPAEQ